MPEVGRGAAWLLLVEDDSLVARTVDRMVEHHTAMSVRCAHTLHAAVDAVRDASPPAAMLLDYDLGGAGADGVDVLLALRRLDVRAPAVFFSSMPARVVEQRLERAGLGPSPCLTKPVPPAVLRRWLAAHSRAVAGRQRALATTGTS